MNEHKKMRELLDRLKAASQAYYNGEEVMSNFEFDRLSDELRRMEELEGFSFTDSITKTVGAEAVDELPKYRHEYPALSLAKTKDIDEYCGKFRQYIQSNPRQTKGAAETVTLMWKMDGSTVQLYYEGGRLIHAVTRGNGEVGSVIDHNAPYIHGIPTKIPYHGKLVVRGEAVMHYSEFARINSMLPAEEQYKNPRNLANSTISLLDSSEMRTRDIQFYAFELVAKQDTAEDASGHDPYKLWFDGMGNTHTTFMQRLTWLGEQGFQVVERRNVHYTALKDTMLLMEKTVPALDFPVDGLVGVMDDCAFTDGLTGTGHNPHIMRGFAFKWADETQETVIRSIEWSASRTGLLNPVAVFDPVELAGTTVTRASVHNVSYIQSLDLKVGDRVAVYKANMIIPQIADNLDKEECGELDEQHMRMRYHLAPVCPACGQPTIIEQTVGGTRSIVLKCANPDCSAKRAGQFVHFCERDCMNIVGMSESTIEKLVDAGIIRAYADFFRLAEHPEIAMMEGFGEKSWQNMISAAETAKNESGFIGIIHAMGIPNVGKGQAKLLKAAIESWAESSHHGEEADYFDCLREMIAAGFHFEAIEGFGTVIASSLTNWAAANLAEGSAFMTLLDLMPAHPVQKKMTDVKATAIAGKTFVITGAVNHFANREELKARIEELGGKTSGSVSKNTDYLINNDASSTSGKNKKAKELGIRIITEDEFLEMCSESVI